MTTPITWPLAGFDRELVATQAPKLADRGDFATDRAAYDYVLANRNTIIVDDFFLSSGAGPPRATVKLGDTITTADPLTGRSVSMRVVARAQNDWVGNGAFTSTTTLRSLLGSRAVTSRAYIEVRDPEGAVRAIESKYFDRGAKADPLLSLLEQRLSRQTKFFTLMRSFLALGLVIGVAGIGVIMIRAVRERRRQVGVLRSLGLQRSAVSNAFAVEALFVSLEGVLIGVALGLVCTWSITLSDSFGAGLEFTVPLFSIAVFVLGTVIGALLATLAPGAVPPRSSPR